eukprot:TRINITY_DN2971_c0_g1_i6.p1 TRINITY_DN2971_c0_g1~~TRINITY_DN2971_c0_g1_i6.p1  ORF type:complete len:360 (+),score=11.14 TRINITY_DN2971_c0_g1_i6:68-1147(+)
MDQLSTKFVAIEAKNLLQQQVSHRGVRVGITTPSMIRIRNSNGRLLRFGEVIGEGQTGKLRICRDTENQHNVYACKTIPTEKLSCPQVALDVFSEFHALRTVSGHESIVNIIDSSFDELGAHLILELCTGGTVYDFLVGHPFLEEHQVGYFALQLLLALKHCHDLGIVHRDLKPENILLESECTPCVSRIPCRLCLDHRDAYPRERPVCLSTTRLKLADFGYATALSKHKPYASGLYGSALYMAPEIILGDKYGTAADMWSLGVICFTALSGNMPFNGSNEAQTLQRTLEGRPSFDSGRWPIRSTLAKDFVSRLLRADPIERLTATDAFLHPWITQTAMYLAEDEHSSVGALHQDDFRP